MDVTFSAVERAFLELQPNKRMTTKIPYLVVNNFPQLGLLTSLRFLEWVSENPEGVVSLPTGKTPEHFIRWTNYFLKNWSSQKADRIRKTHCLNLDRKPVLSGLHFVQIDEFYPINPKQQNSFHHYVKHYYLRGFGMNENKALLIDPEAIPLWEGKHYSEVFPEFKIDVSLRYRDCHSKTQLIQQQSLYMIDQWCSDYEQKIREMGGIGFFLGGIGPDGHIAFNVRGTDPHSTTRLTATNFETQAVAAADLGGIEISRNRLVITIGLKTIVQNPEAVAIVIAAGEAKADVVKNALESLPSNIFPATVLQQLKNSRFYLTKGAAVQLHDSLEDYYHSGEWNTEKTDRIIIDLCSRLDKFGKNLSVADIVQDPYGRLIPDLNNNTVEEVMERIRKRIQQGLIRKEHQRFFHTGPHHDDIMLGLLPEISQQLRQVSNEFNFVILTSGFTAVTNSFVIESLRQLQLLLSEDRIEMLHYPDFFEQGYKFKWDKDVYHYLNKVASGEPHERIRAVSHRLVRILTEIYQLRSIGEMSDKIEEIITLLIRSYDGEKNPPDIQRLKGMIREFEEELVWAHYGVQVKNVHHLRLGFYTGDIFTEQPENQRDVQPILEMLREKKPTVISLALDPEGSGPDTHYKVMQAIAEAIRLWRRESDLSSLRIMGYRNVWYRFHPAEADVMVPVSLNALSNINESFTNCYLSQVHASFPSYLHDGKFSELAQKIWTEQYKSIRLLLGKSYFYQNDHPKLRATHGLIFYKEMDVDTFLMQARELKQLMEG